MSALLAEKEKIPFASEEPSVSFRVLNKIVRVVFPRKYPIFNSAQSLARYTDNVIDDGNNLEEALNVLWAQKRTIKAFEEQSDAGDLSSAVQKELASIIGAVSPPLREPFIKAYDKVLGYFEDELRHRVSLAPYEREELWQHINGGYTSVFRLIKIMLFESDLTNPGYIYLTRIHGQAEPLGDLAEDLERGAVVHCRENGAEWVDMLHPQREVPYAEINKYVIKRRQPLAQAMLRLAHTPIKEFKGIFGILHSCDYYHRAFELSRLRFQPKKPIIFAQKRIS